MLKDERNKIEEKINFMGDYMKMEFLSGCLRKNLELDTRKFVLIRLGGLYESRKMFFDAGKMMCAAAEININVQNKINDLVKAIELFIRARNYNEADYVTKKAISCGNGIQKKEIEKNVKEFYKTWARFYLEQNKKKHAMQIYEKLLRFNIDEKERTEFQDRLLEIYESLGKIREYNFLKKRNE